MGLSCPHIKVTNIDMFFTNVCEVYKLPSGGSCEVKNVQFPGVYYLIFGNIISEIKKNWGKNIKKYT